MYYLNRPLHSALKLKKVQFQFLYIISLHALAGPFEFFALFLQTIEHFVHLGQINILYNSSKFILPIRPHCIASPESNTFLL